MGELLELPKNAAALYTQLTKQIGKLQDTQCRKKSSFTGVQVQSLSGMKRMLTEVYPTQFNIGRKVGHNTTCSQAKRSRDEREVAEFMDSIPLRRQARKKMTTHWGDHNVQRVYKVNTRETRFLNFVFSPHTFSRSTYFPVVYLVQHKLGKQNSSSASYTHSSSQRLLTLTHEPNKDLAC